MKMNTISSIKLIEYSRYFRKGKTDSEIAKIFNEKEEIIKQYRSLWELTFRNHKFKKKPLNYGVIKWN